MPAHAASVLVARVQISWWPDFDTTRMVPFSARSLMAARARLPLICERMEYHTTISPSTPPVTEKADIRPGLKGLSHSQQQSTTHPEPIGQD